LIQNITKKT